MFWFCFAHAKAGQKRAGSKPEQIQNNSKTTAKQQQNKRKTTQRVGKTSSKQQQNNGEGGNLPAR
jgi:hypothetical protein